MILQDLLHFQDDLLWQTPMRNSMTAKVLEGLDKTLCCSLLK